MIGVVSGKYMNKQVGSIDPVGSDIPLVGSKRFDAVPHRIYESLVAIKRRAICLLRIMLGIQTAEESRVSGHIDSIDFFEIRGWAVCRRSFLWSAKIEIYDDDQVLTTIRARSFRKDLWQSAIGCGFHGFIYSIPDSLRDGRVHRLSIRGQGEAHQAFEGTYDYWYPQGYANPDYQRPGSFIGAIDSDSIATDFIKGCQQQLLENGYALLPKWISHDLCDKIIRDIEPEFNTVQCEGMHPRAKRHDLWRQVDSVGDLACHSASLALLRTLYGREPIPFQTLNLRTGSEQRAHPDSIHFSCLPKRYMCGLWVALEDVYEDAGPLFVYQKSHTLPEIDFCDTNLHGQPEPYELYENVIEKLMLEKEFKRRPMIIKKGDAILWCSNLVHGGMPITNSNRTRWSQVTHYYFADCVYYIPMFSISQANEYYLKEIHNIQDKQKVVPSISGRQFQRTYTLDGRYQIRLERNPLVKAIDQ